MAEKIASRSSLEAVIPAGSTARNSSFVGSNTSMNLNASCVMVVLVQLDEAAVVVGRIIDIAAASNDYSLRSWPRDAWRRMHVLVIVPCRLDRQLWRRSPR